MNSIQDIINDANDQIEALLGDTVAEVTASELGLDPRASSKFWANEEGIIIRLGNRHTMDYYGGFEYVDKDCVTVIGDYVFYSSEDSRVAGHIEHVVMEEE
jgi:hypothetical protein